MSLQNIYTKLSKYSNAQGLKVQERENTKFAKKWAFASVSELDESFDNLQRGFADSKELLSGLVDFIDQFENEMKYKAEYFNELYDDILKTNAEANIVLQDFNDSAFELGINPDEIKQYSDLKSQAVSMTEQIDSIDFFMNSAKKYINF
tara:strand:- start:2439 stop:2885 length:447 start_codon:yes stop_codon:yes gene_type:complete